MKKNKKCVENRRVSIGWIQRLYNTFGGTLTYQRLTNRNDFVSDSRPNSAAPTPPRPDSPSEDPSLPFPVQFAPGLPFFRLRDFSSDSDDPDSVRDWVRNTRRETARLQELS